ncbi:MAG: hypothetical protein MPF33_04205 [Candidatus Aramenus sp.]|jgi:hypothetical protein|nr:hypothetical protein [Candidatus Aramenus sp.]
MNFRRQNPELFKSYKPIYIGEGVCGFERNGVTVIFKRYVDEMFKGTVKLASRYGDILTGEALERGEVELEVLLSKSPVAVLRRE